MSKDTYNEYFTDVSQGGKYFQLTFYTNEKEKFLAMETLARKCIDADLDVDVVEVRHGEWKKSSPYNRFMNCSVCGFGQNHTTFRYCPNCGAKMDGERKENGT